MTDPNAPRKRLGCGTIFLWIVVAMIAGCAGLVMLGKSASNAVEQARNAPPSKVDKYEHWLNSNSLDQLSRTLDAINEAQGARLFTSSSLGVDSCTVTVDADVYDLKSDQDKRVIDQLVSGLCAKSYRRPFGDTKGNVRNVPEGGLNVELRDLSGSTLYRDLWTRQ